ncbi:gas vesicle protein GvpN [Fictibacillus sp. KU28468]|uniref:gas vesicle protein GvpN n=1 Tax=Fictibacillus sp. KU28468 TaxID=2991053 RepID=UPI00223D465F|nr:gas vesicle protein GvpN [Fictibacillus sp. KU28468]UZJ79842.1 gas vesicle protein GvpN [Fictibacillus sp. KU28468]
MTVLTENKNKVKSDLLQHDGIKNLISRSLNYLSAGYPVHFTGPPGVGKTTLALLLAKKRKRPVMLMHGNRELSNADLIGAYTGYTTQKVVDNFIRSVYKKEENVTETWNNGRLLDAVKNGYTLIYDEFTRSEPSTNNIFLSILEEGILPLYGTKQKDPFMKVHPKFTVIFTSNPSEYAGVYETQDALLDRLITIPLDYTDKDTEAAIVSSKTGVDSNQAKAITSFVAALREKCSENSNNGPSLRASIMIAKLANEADIPINGKDEDFQRLCLDILLAPVAKCMDEKDPSKLRELIISECKKAVKE